MVLFSIVSSIFSDDTLLLSDDISLSIKECCQKWSAFRREGKVLYRVTQPMRVVISKVPGTPTMVVKQYQDTHKKWIRDKIEKEYALAIRLRHRNVSTYHFGVEERGQVYIFMDYAGIPLHHFMTDVKSMPEYQCKALVKQLVEVLAYLHGKGIVHRDLKPANIGISQGDKVKVFDFGESFSRKELRGTDACLHSEARSLAGTANYMAPEALEWYESGDHSSVTAARMVNTTKIDIWSLGCVAYFVLTGNELINPEGMSLGDIHNIAVQHSRKFADRTSRPLLGRSSDASNFLKCCLALHPKDRPSARKLLLHPWFRG